MSVNISGNSGIRGYYYQVLATLLDSVSDDNWDSIKIEPSTADDKVDIEWIAKDLIRAVQVKSSINNFQRSMVIDWIIKLVKDAKSTYEIFGLPIQYTLCLIGSTDSNADKFISDLHAGRIDVAEHPKLQEIEEDLSNVTIDKRGFNLDDLIGSSYFKMQKYLERNQKQASSKNVEMLCDVIISQLFVRTTQSRSMSKALFVQLIDRYINSGDYGITEINNGTSNISLAFYERNKVLESTVMNGITLDHLPILAELKREAIKNVEAAQSIQLPKPQIQKINSDDQESSEDLLEISKTISQALSRLNFDIYGFVPATAEQIKEELKQLSQELLQITLREEDFYFGDLKKRAMDIQLMFGAPRNIPQGTKEEVDKYFAIKNAHYNLVLYKEMLKYNEYLQSCFPLPIILKNTGSLYDEEIHVTISFPANAKVVTAKRMEAPFIELVERFIKEEVLFEKLIIPKRDHKIQEYEPINFTMHSLPKLPSLYGKGEYTDEDFKNFVKYVFEYEHFEEEGSDIITYGFKGLNPSTNMQFPSLILVQAEEDFGLEYTIYSKYLKQPIHGVLNWIHPITN